MADQSHIVEVNLNEDVVQISSQAGDAITSVGFLGFSVSSMVVGGDVEIFCKLLVLLPPLNCGLAPARYEDDFWFAWIAILVVSKGDAVAGCHCSTVVVCKLRHEMKMNRGCISASSI